MVQNCSPSELTLGHDEIIGFIEHTDEKDMQQLNANSSHQWQKMLTTSHLWPRKKTVHTNKNESRPYKDKFVRLLLKHHKAFSANKYDLG